MILKPQEKSNYCVCSILQAIFKINRIEISQDEIANNLEPSENGFFTEGEIITSYLKQKGFEYSFYRHNATPFNEPEILLEDMVLGTGLLGFHKHTYLFLEFKDPIVSLVDPKDDSIKHFELRNMREAMAESKNGFFGLVKKLK